MELIPASPNKIKLFIPSKHNNKSHTFSTVTKITQTNAQTIRLKDEIKFLYMKNEKKELNN